MSTIEFGEWPCSMWRLPGFGENCQGTAVQSWVRQGNNGSNRVNVYCPFCINAVARSRGYSRDGVRL